VIITVFGDESGTHDASPIMMLAGHVGKLGPWNSFDEGWRRAIKRVGLPGYFHATEHLNTEKGEKFSPLAARLVKKHTSFGYVIELDKDSYDTHYIANVRPKKPQLDKRYSLCFRYLLSLLLTQGPSLFEKDDLEIDIILEEGAAGSADVHRVVHLLRKEPTLQQFAKMIRTIFFGEKKKFPGLQVSQLQNYFGCRLKYAGVGRYYMPFFKSGN
jgi:hypothetical protein